MCNLFLKIDRPGKGKKQHGENMKLKEKIVNLNMSPLDLKSPLVI